jgi:hypothetical protein
MRFIPLFLVAVVASTAETITLPITDTFADQEMAGRTFARGPWEVKDHQTTCVQSEELVKKYKNHGPVIMYDVTYTDATISFSWKPSSAVESMALVLNSEQGHVFRLLLKPASGLMILSKDEGEAKGKTMGNLPGFTANEWMAVKCMISGTDVTVTYDDTTRTMRGNALKSPRNNISILFSHGNFSVKDVKVTGH